MSTATGVSIADLDRVALHVAEAQKAARVAQHFASPGMDRKEAAQAVGYAEKAAEEAGAALVKLKGMGANTRPGKHADAPDLAMLAALDTPDARELLAVLERAVEIAERVDASRGRTLPADAPLQPGETRGVDLAETLAEIALRLRGEVHGAKGRE